MSDELEPTPNCPDCLHPLDVAGSSQHPYWRCEVCGFTAIST